eukprot:3847635-Amphidinium_carterae.1
MREGTSQYFAYDSLRSASKIETTTRTAKIIHWTCSLLVPVKSSFGPKDQNTDALERMAAE